MTTKPMTMPWLEQYLGSSLKTAELKAKAFLRKGKLLNPLPYMPILGSTNSAANKDMTGFEFQFFIHLQILASSFYFHLQNQDWTGIFF